MLVAGLAKATPAELWEIADDAERAVPKVDLSSHQTGAVSEDANLFAQQEANRRRSTWLVIGFVVFFAWVGFGGDLAFGLLTADAPPGGYHHVVPVIGIVHHPGRRRHLLVLLALRAAPGAVVHRRPGDRRARHAPRSGSW